MHQLIPAENTELERLAQRIEALDAAARQYVLTQAPANTQRAYALDWRAWQDYTAVLGIPENTGSAGGLVVHLERAAKAPASIDRQLTGAVAGLRERGLVIDKAITRPARAALNGYKRRLAEAAIRPGRGPATAVSVKQLRLITAACPADLAGTRDRALVLIGFAIAARRSELASLLISDITESEEGLVIQIRWGKTGGRTVAVPHGSNPATCPVRAWRAWLNASGITEGPALRRIDRHGRLLGAMSGQAAGEAVARAAQRAGLELRFTGHSLRAGLATEARRAGHDAKTIAAQTGHQPNSPVLHGYMQITDRWADNAVAGIGL